VNIRIANYGDLKEIRSVCDRNGLVDNKVINEEIWKTQPATKKCSSFPIGWVLEDNNNKIVGVFLNFFMDYTLNRYTFKIAIGSSWAVDKKYRSKYSVRLLRRFIYQEKVDLIIVNTASDTVGKILKAFKFKDIPIQDYSEVIYWILDYPKFIKSAFIKKINMSIWPISFLLGELLRFYYFIIRRNNCIFLSKNVTEVKCFDHRFDDFWRELSSKDNFMADRSRKALKWRFERAIKEEEISVLALYHKQKLNGYVAIMKENNKTIGLNRIKIIDIQILYDVENSAGILIESAIKYARNQGAHVLELIGLSEGVRHQAFKTKPSTRLYPHSPFYYMAKNKKLRSVFSNNAKWVVSLYDGDGSLR